MDKNKNTAFPSRLRFLWLLMAGLASICFAAPSADIQTSKSLKAEETWDLMVPSASVNFLEVHNNGFDTVTKVFDSNGALLSQSTSWRGREGRYLLALDSPQGDRAASIEIRNTESSKAFGKVAIVWHTIDTSDRNAASIHHGLKELAFAGDMHATHDKGEHAHSDAADAYRAALSSLNGSSMSYWIADIYFELGVVNRHLGLLQEANISNQQALNAYQMLDDKQGMAAANNALGIVAYQLSEYHKAIDYFNQDINLRTVDLGKFSQARTYNNIAIAYWQLDQYQAAIDAYQKSLSLFASGRVNLSTDQALGLSIDQIRNKGDVSKTATAMNNLALAMSTVGEISVAEALWTKTTELAQAADSVSVVAAAELNLGKLYQQQGRLELALEYFVSAASYYTESDSDYWLGETLAGMGRVYASIDEYSDAVSYYERAQNLAGENQNLQSNLLRLLANANWRLGNMGPAESQFNSARASFTDSKQPGQAAIVVSEHSLFQYEQGESNQAIEKQREAFATLLSLGNALNAARAQSRLGQLLLAEGQIEQAERELQAALKGHRAVSDELFELDTLTALSRAQSGVAALDTAKAATELADTIRTRTHSADIQTSFLASRRGAFEQYINLLVDAGDVELAWDVNEKIRARTLLDLIQDANHSDNRLTAISTNVDLQVLQQQLDSNVAMLSYYLGEQRSHLWVIANDALEYYPLPAASEINLAANELTEVLRNHRQSPSRIAYVASQLSDMIIRPATDAIAGRELVVVADGGLQLVPFALLPMGASNSVDATLIAQTNVTYTPSARIFNLLNGYSNQPSSNILVLADPLSAGTDDDLLQAEDAFAEANVDFSSMLAQRSLSQTGVNLTRLPGARLEAQAIADTASRADNNGTIDIMTGAQANHDFVMNGGLNNYGVVHFATHGVVDADMPELSGLVLAYEQGTENMSYLRPHEIATLELDADLVVLSGCETGIGKSVGSEGLFSLSRPFLIAGARQVISSLWQVSDRATALLMERFYFHLLQENQLPEVALRSAQQWLSSQPGWEHPYFWAGFVVQGGRSLPTVNQQYASIEDNAQDTQSLPLTLVNAAL